MKRKAKAEIGISRRVCLKVSGLALAVGGVMAGMTAGRTAAGEIGARKGLKTTFRFVLIPKVVHPWFEEVHQGALVEAELLKKQAGIEIRIEYSPPSKASVAEQNSILMRAAESRPDGIAMDPLEAVERMPQIAGIMRERIPIIVFDSPSSQPGITSVGNDFSEQGVMAAERLVKLIGARGKVAIMQGVPTAPNHKERHDAQIRVLERNPGITIVEGGTDNDDIQTAQKEAAAVLAAHPDLKGYLCCDASGPIGIAAAVEQAGKTGRVKVVGMDSIKPILQAIKEGVIDSSSATIPRMQGAMSVLMLWQAALGVKIPRRVDTGIDFVTSENVESFLAAV